MDRHGQVRKEGNIMGHPNYDKATFQITPEQDRVSKIISAVWNEYTAASEKFNKFNSAHEGYAVILEELDELWDEVKLKTGTQMTQFQEAKQVAAMAIRFMIDCCKDVEL